MSGQTAADRQSEHAALEGLLEVARRLGESSDLSLVLQTVIDALRDLLHAERATVWVYDRPMDELFTHVAHGMAAQVVRIPAQRGIVGAAAQSRQVMLVPDAYADERFDRSVDARTGFLTRDILAIPLLDDEGALVGVAQVLNRVGGAFGESDIRIGRALAAQAAVAVRRARLLEDHEARLRLEEEMEVARTIQQGSFPTALPMVARYSIYAQSTPADVCGGDAFDVIGIGAGGILAEGQPAERVIFLCADATGHGVGPALSSMQARGMVRMGAQFNQPLSVVAPAVNRQFCADLPAGRFITAWIALLDTTRNEIECFSAGQGPIYVFRSGTGQFEVVDSDALPFGITADAMPFDQTQRLSLGVGDMVVVLTDGYSEAPSPTGEQFGEERLQQLIREGASGPLVNLMTRIDTQVVAFAAAQTTPDDRTAIFIRRDA